MSASLEKLSDCPRVFVIAKLLERLHEVGSARDKAQNPELHMGSFTEIVEFSDLPRTRLLQTRSIESPPMQLD